jgi:hypothetical protein
MEGRNNHEMAVIVWITIHHDKIMRTSVEYEIISVSASPLLWHLAEDASLILI